VIKDHNNDKQGHSSDGLLLTVDWSWNFIHRS